jgi:hypothetical protein
LTTAALGFIGLKFLNAALLKTFFASTKARMALLQQHRDLSKTLLIDRCQSQNKSKPVLRVLYSDRGLVGWHSPLITS